MAGFRGLPEFDPTGSITWDVYAERLHFCLEASDIEEDSKKRAVLLSACGHATYEIVRSLCAPKKPGEVEYKELVKLLTSHFAPAPSKIVQRFLFNKRDQQVGEKFSSYLAELRKLADTCSFHEDSRDEMLRDRIVCGVRDEALQRRLLAESDLTLQKAVDAAIAAETAGVNLNELRGSITGGGDTSKSANAVTGKRNANYSTNKRDNAAATMKPCFRCGDLHKPDVCRCKEVVCRFCKKKGHIERVCLAKAKNKTPQRRTMVNQVGNTDEDSYGLGELFNVNMNDRGKANLFKVNININGELCEFEVDSGASDTIMSLQTFNRLWPINKPEMRPCETTFLDFSMATVETAGVCDVLVTFKNIQCTLPMVITRNTRANLLGRNWFDALKIEISGINKIEVNSSLDELVLEFQEVFSEGLGQYKGPPIKFALDPSIAPVSCRARNIPFALRGKVEAELEKLVRQGVLQPIDHSEWSSPIVPVVKSSGEIRICADYKATINKALRVPAYPMPVINEILASLGECKRFAKLDLAQAYQQLSVDENAAKAQAVITHRGLFKVNRLQFGVNVAPQLFQKFINSRLAGIDGVFPYFDDILVCARDERQILDRLPEVLQRLQQDGLKLKRAKCVFNVQEIEFLGFRIDSEGIRPTQEKVKAIWATPEPTCKKELQAFLGLLNFYHTFLKGKADIVEPLHRLLDEDKPWEWTGIHKIAFESVKSLVTSDSLLVHYNLELPLVMVCDASPWGVGIVLSHIMPGGVEAPIAFHSQTLSATQRNYAQLDREAFAIIAGIKKFHKYLYGREFTIITDHKPLLGLLGATKPTPERLSPRMLRWILFLANYQYELEYRPGAKIQHADALSRLPVSSIGADPEGLGDVLMIEMMPEKILNAEQVEKLTGKDLILSRVRDWLLKGWPSDIPPEYIPFRNKRAELSVYKNCVLWGSRVVIPEKARQQAVELLHATHQGIVRMKALARSYMWWPGLDQDIEKIVKECKKCQEVGHAPPRAPIHPWEWASDPWSRIHVDHAGPIKGQNFLIVVDSYSKWLEVKKVPSVSSGATICALREIFATHGCPAKAKSRIYLLSRFPDFGVCVFKIIFLNFILNPEAVSVIFS
ncbi:uncharacterized protein K02A2.6-like [Photinus pyralis]|uniref:uncharacterized protein K02A2.6-like n=1 Tax=Photinus pyralis TaxID=7054 RepID=UPI0012677C1D|nr:uncharacterized protein K02A2.6-like [Photinus pyralis]